MRMLQKLRKEFRTATKGELILLLVIGLIMGSVFTIGEQYWNKQVMEDQCIPVTAMFDSYREHHSKSRFNVTQVSVFFEDHDRLTLNGTCYSEEVRRNMENLEKGTEVSMLLHPNSQEILRMDTNGKGIVIFDDAIQALDRSTTVFLCLGVFCYVTGFVGLVGLVIKRKQ